jgi:hypothetical protein
MEIANTAICYDFNDAALQTGEDEGVTTFGELITI